MRGEKKMCLLRGLVVFLACLVPAFAAGGVRAADPPLKSPLTLIIRCDDYSSVSDTEFELRLIDLFRKYHVPITLGVIPCVASDDEKAMPPGKSGIPLTEAKAKILRDAMAEGIVEVAQHGYNHRYNGPAWRGEFVGLSYEEQLRRISDGRAILSQALGRDITAFVPPNEKYDANTLRVLQEQQFQILSADIYGGPAGVPTLKYMPKTSDLADFWQDIARVNELQDPSPVMIVLCHNFDFSDEKQHTGTLSLDDLDKILSWAGSQPNVRLTTMEALARERGGFDQTQLQEMQDLASFGQSRFLPSRAAALYSLPTFPGSPQDMSAMRARRQVVFASFWITSLLAMLAAAWVAAVASRFLPAGLLGARYWLFPCLLFAGTCLACQFLVRSPRMFKITFCLVEASLFAAVACVAWYRQKRSRGSAQPA